MTPFESEQFAILKRICIRGRSLFLEQEYSVGVDMFEHMEQAVERLRLYREQDHE